MLATPLMLDATSLPALNRYSDYGVVEQNDSSNNSPVSISNDPFGYSDEYTDSESGLQYLQVRYYNPTIMRFTEMDTYPLLNRYVYANENPIMDDDPSGHSAVGASFTSGGVKGWEGSLVGMGAAAVIGLIGGVVASVFTGGTSLSAILLAETVVGSLSGAGGQTVQDGVEHKSVNGLQLGVAAAGGAVMSAISFGIGEYFSDALKSPAGSVDESGAISSTNNDAPINLSRESHSGKGSSGDVYHVDDRAYKIGKSMKPNLEAELWNIYFQNEIPELATAKVQNVLRDGKLETALSTPWIDGPTVSDSELLQGVQRKLVRNLKRYMLDLTTDGNVRLYNNKIAVPIDFGLMAHMHTVF